MNIVARASRGNNIVGRPQARAAWYPDPTAQASQCEVWWRYSDEPPAAARLVGVFKPGQEGSIPYNPFVDRDVIFSVVTISADGTRSVREIADAVEQSLTFNRDTEAPMIGQVGASTADAVEISVKTGALVRKRKLRTSPNSDMSDASVTIRDFEIGKVPDVVTLSRTAGIVPDFSWTGNNPATNGFTKVGSGTTAASTTPPGWRITTTGTDAATNYTKDSWPAGAFDDGFTVELMPPTVAAIDAGSPSGAVALRVEDGAKRYELTFDADEVKLNTGSAHAHGGEKVRLVVDAGGATADLWIGDTKVENNTAGAATGTSGLTFGDLVTTDDAEAVWAGIEYAFTPQDVKLSETIYVGVSHSSGTVFGTESDILEVSFASEGGAGGSSGNSDLVPRDRYDFDPL